MTLNPDSTRRRYTPEEYLAEEERAEFRSEYHDGEVFAMVGGTEAHSTITMNLALVLGAQLRGRPCRPFGNDMKVMINQERKFYYPDLSVVCGEPVYRDEKKIALTNPRLIIEVLSESTAAFDRDQKFEAYGQMPSLTDYLLVAQDRARIEHFTRQANGDWLLHTASGLHETIDIPAIACKLSLADVYDRVAFASA